MPTHDECRGAGDEQGLAGMFRWIFGGICKAVDLPRTPSILATTVIEKTRGREPQTAQNLTELKKSDPVDPFFQPQAGHAGNIMVRDRRCGRGGMACAHRACWTSSTHKRIAPCRIDSPSPLAKPVIVRSRKRRRGKSMGQLIDESLEFYGIKTREEAADIVRRARTRAGLNAAEAARLGMEETRAARRERA